MNGPIAKRFGSRDGLDDSSDTMEQLNQMISKFESLSSKPNSASKKAAGNNTAATLERLRLNNALREVFANRFCHIFLSYEHFVILQQDIEDDLTPDGLDKENTMVMFIYFEKATRFCEIFIVDLFYVMPVKSTKEIWPNFVAFSEYMNSKYKII